jgi:pimeloyl-ACP methyl ester carboxylesterase
MPERHHVFLIPGFFGFANIGELLYFAHVRSYLPSACARLGLELDVHTVATSPTASIPRRAERLLDGLASAAGDDAPIHLVGHSSGGLDARLLASPGVTLRSDHDPERYARRIRTVVMVSTPNHGTPVASFFTSLFGQKLLELLSLGTIYVLRFGRLPSSVLFRLGAIFARLDDLVGLRHTVVDQLYEQLLSEFTPERRDAIEHFLGEVRTDQGLLPQLTPEGMDLFNAATRDRPGVRYGCVISYARRPGLLSSASVGLDPYGQATHALFYGLHRVAAGMPREQLPRLDDGQLEALYQTYGITPEPGANDGVVPTLSQVQGELVHATRADHLDVLGHFGDGSRDPPHIDWLSSGTGFTRGAFEALWNDVASYLAGRHPSPGRTVSPRSRVQHLLHLFRR